MNKNTLTRPAGSNQKYRITPQDLGFEAEFSKELTVRGKRSATTTNTQNTQTSGTPRQNLAIYPGE